MRKKLLQRFILTFIAVAAMFSTICVRAASFDKTLEFSASVGMPFHNRQGAGFEDRILKEICHRLGMKVQIHFSPSERSLKDLEDGVDDGTLARVAVVKEKYPNIVQVKLPVFQQEFVVFTRRAKFIPDSWSKLAEYHVGILYGWKILEKHLRKNRNLIEVDRATQLFELLNLGRIDVAIYNRWSGMYLLKKMHLKKIRILEPPLVQVPIYFFLAKKNASLEEPFRRTLAAMKSDGTYQRIFNSTLGLMTK